MQVQVPSGARIVLMTGCISSTPPAHGSGARSTVNLFSATVDRQSRGKQSAQADRCVTHLKLSTVLLASAETTRPWASVER